jgi:hypothetical protein
MSSIGDKIARRVETIIQAVIPILVWGIIAAGGYLLFPIVSPYLSRPDVLAIILVVMAIAIITLSRQAARKPPRPNKRFLKKLFDSEPISPQHESPNEPPMVAGDGLHARCRAVERRFFADFAEFADIVNWWFDKYVKRPWRLQGLPDDDVRLNVDFSSGPEFGRCYSIFHNQVELGRLEISPSFLDEPEVTTEIELRWVRLLSYDTIVDFLSAIAMFVCDSNRKDGKPTNPDQTIAVAVTKALWETQQITQFADLDGQDWGELSLHFCGLPTRLYFDQREALQKKRADASDPRAQLSTKVKEIAEQVRSGMSEALGTKTPR